MTAAAILNLFFSAFFRSIADEGNRAKFSVQNADIYWP